MNIPFSKEQIDVFKQQKIEEIRKNEKQLNMIKGGMNCRMRVQDKDSGEIQVFENTPKEILEELDL